MDPAAGKDYDLYLLNSRGVEVKDSTNGGSDSEEISYTPTNSSKVFYVKVIGYDGENSTQPYTVSVSW